MLKDNIQTLYCELLGEAIEQQMHEKGILQHQIFNYYSDDDIEPISKSTVNQVLKGKRNMTLNVANAFQDSLGLPNVKSLFFPSVEFCETLITQLTQLILTDEHFDESATQKLFQTKETLIQENISSLATALYNHFPDFPQEETSFQIADNLTEWLVEFVALVAHLS